MGPTTHERSSHNVLYSVLGSTRVTIPFHTSHDSKTRVSGLRPGGAWSAQCVHCVEMTLRDVWTALRGSLHLLAICHFRPR
jgi:hypothetical protein